MQISEFQLTLDEENDLFDSLQQIVKNLKVCNTVLLTRIPVIINQNFKKPENLLMEPPNSMQVLCKAQRLLLEIADFFRFLPFPDLFISILSRSSVYIPKQSADLLLKVLSHSAEDNLPEFFVVSNQIWKAKKQGRRLEDEYLAEQEINKELVIRAKQHLLRLNQIKLDLGLVKTEINTLTMCIQSFLNT